MKKKYVFIISLFLAVMVFIVEANLPSINDACEKLDYRCMDIVGNILIASLILVPVPFFSLLTYFLNEKVFRAWLRFTYVWVPFSFAVVLFASSRQSANIVGLSDQAIFGFLAWGLYVLISLIIIIWKYFSTRGK